MADTATKRKRGEGSIFRDAGSQTWRIKYSDHGKAHRESSGSSDIAVAKKLLKLRLAEITTGDFTPRSSIRMQELFDDVVLDYLDAGQSTKEIQGRWRLHLADHFARRRASDIGSDHLKRYVNHRRGEGAQPGDGQQGVGLAETMLQSRAGIGSTQGEVRSALPEVEGGRSHAGDSWSRIEYDCLAEACGEVAVVVENGFRARRDLRLATARTHGLERLEGRADRFGRQLHPAGGRHHQERRRAGGLHDHWSSALLLQCCCGKADRDFVFSRPNGSPVISFRRAWEAACIAAGVGRFLCRALRRGR